MTAGVIRSQIQIIIFLTVTELPDTVTVWPDTVTEWPDSDSDRVVWYSYSDRVAWHSDSDSCLTQWQWPDTVTVTERPDTVMVRVTGHSDGDRVTRHSNGDRVTWHTDSELPASVTEWPDSDSKFKMSKLSAGRRSMTGISAVIVMEPCSRTMTSSSPVQVHQSFQGSHPGGTPSQSWPSSPAIPSGNSSSVTSPAAAGALPLCGSEWSAVPPCLLTDTRENTFTDGGCSRHILDWAITTNNYKLLSA